MALDQYLARLWWNSANWVHPTGEAARAETGTFAARMGFGGEEWLFNLQWMLDGWKYGFLEPVRGSRARLEGQEIDVRLFTIAPEKGWLYVGHLRRCEVLTTQRATAAHRRFEDEGWLREMMEQVEFVGGDPRAVASGSVFFNVRFRPAEAELYDPMVPVGPDDRLRAFKRYKLTSLTGERSTVVRQWNTRVAAERRRPTGKRPRKGTEATVAELVHNQLQNELFDWLVQACGRRAVSMEEGFVDLKVRTAGRLILIEVKSDARPRYAVREAVGQLLEYAYRCATNGEGPAELVVAGPGELDNEDRTYLGYLEKHRNLPLRYLCIRRGLEPDLMWLRRGHRHKLLPAPEPAGSRLDRR